MTCVDLISICALQQILFWINVWCAVIFAGLMMGMIVAWIANSDIDW